MDLLNQALERARAASRLPTCGSWKIALISGKGYADKTFLGFLESAGGRTPLPSPNNQHKASATFAPILSHALKCQTDT